MRRTDTEQRGDDVEVDRVYARFASAAPELIELLGPGNTPDTNDGALLGGGGKQGTGRVDGEEGDGRFVRLDDVRDGE